MSGSGLNESINPLEGIVAAVEEDAGVSIRHFRASTRITAPRMLIRKIGMQRGNRQREEYQRTRDVRPYSAAVLTAGPRNYVLMDMESFVWLLSEAVKADPAGWARPNESKRNSDEGKWK